MRHIHLPLKATLDSQEVAFAHLQAGFKHPWRVVAFARATLDEFG
jgi:hypothetical protein